MAPWVLRTLGMSVLHAAAAVALAKIAVFQPGDTTFARAAALALLVGAAALWSALDGWMDRPDSGRTWFITGLLSGPVAGVLSLIGKAVFVDRTGVSELGPAITTGAAFTALLVLVPAGLGLLVGGRLPRPGSDLDTPAGDGAETRGGESADGAGTTRERISSSAAERADVPADETSGDLPHHAESAPAVAVLPDAPDTPDEREETAMMAKPRPDRRPRPRPRLRRRGSDQDPNVDPNV